MTQKPAVQTESHGLWGWQLYLIMCVKNLKDQSLYFPPGTVVLEIRLAGQPTFQIVFDPDECWFCLMLEETGRVVTLESEL